MFLVEGAGVPLSVSSYIQAVEGAAIANIAFHCGKEISGGLVPVINVLLVRTSFPLTTH